ncbi:Gfo/Idh/MocA family protein [Rubripirellula reticaptiva]|uniref:Oxidoreductase family, NAD-binding Rossmann fold n=1 Tax=Rubripirellula reticaptiva TaxID=2528013 RepID=A0A5C6EGF4_9BACT|nr:Gfo/Idh/MocA family oxidoreductase [Rubripirellula reticaptiva]TWU47660.1 Oxidoreductase family, NAD-binding Rossmann fold [Rubripirellula reticaptiva]
MRRIIKLLGFGFLLASVLRVAHADDAAATTIRIGLIGLDTSHSPALVKTFNDPNPKDDSFAGQRIVAAYPFGSRTIESSASRIPKYTEEVKQQGVEIVDSIEQLLAKVDCVLLETNDGTLHLEQALQIFRASKPVFIDKPTGSNLAEVLAIFRAAKHYDVPMFSSSSLRFSSGAQAIRNGKVGRVLGCNSYSPCAIEPSHVDLFWYGIHGVETLYTCMGSGCESVAHTSTGDFEFSSGVWNDGRIGTFRGIRSGKSGYGGTVFGETAIEGIGSYDGYRPLFVEIAKFFRTHQSPIDDAETIEIYAFMQAASESKNAGGIPIRIDHVMNQAEQAATKLLANELQ